MTGTLWGLAGPIRWNVLGSVIVCLLVTACYVAQGVLVALTLGAVFRTHDVVRGEWCLAGLLAALLARGALLWLPEVAAQKTAQVTKESMRERLLAKLIELGPSYANAQQSGKLQQTVVGGVEAIETYYSRYVPTVFVAIFGCMMVLAELAAVDWRSALVLAPFVALVPIFSRTWQARRRSYSRDPLFGVRAAFGAYLLDSLQGLVTLKAFSATIARRIGLVKRAVELRLEAMRTLLVSLASSGITGLLSTGGVATLLAWNERPPRIEGERLQVGVDDRAIFGRTAHHRRPHKEARLESLEGLAVAVAVSPVIGVHEDVGAALQFGIEAARRFELEAAGAGPR